MLVSRCDCGCRCDKCSPPARPVPHGWEAIDGGHRTDVYCGGCGQLIVVRADDGATECGGVDEGVCSVVAYATDLGWHGKARADEEWALSHEDTAPPSAQACAAALASHEAL